MLNEISCWYVDWNAIGAVGAWVGGLATASAAVWAVHVATKAWKDEKLRRRVKAQSLVLLMIPELAHVSLAAKSLSESPDAVLGDQKQLQYVKSRLSVAAAGKLVDTNGELEQQLALAVSEFVVTTTILCDALDRWESGPVRTQKAKDAILRVADLTLEKVDGLSRELVRYDESYRPILSAATGKE